MRALWPHGVAAAATLGVLALWIVAFPSVALLVARAWADAHRRPSSGSIGVPEFHVYDVSVNVDHLGVAMTVLLIAGICTLGRAVRHRWPFLSWALPFVVALLAGLVVGVSSRNEAPSRSISLLLGFGAGLVALTLVGAYWWTLALTSKRKAGGHE